ncbi:unnamed protein product [Pocillopora meandrina]|uniref:Uncharacterized protein n=1 Tax=Pocillopora meandrina TaxID=46732 RepID=A0AAU9WST1_9CNID|nr:unnamed protein product [Pocillopora meandrina]
MFLFQVLDYVFLGKKSSKFPVYLKFIPRKHSNLHDNRIEGSTCMRRWPFRTPSPV